MDGCLKYCKSHDCEDLSFSQICLLIQCNPNQNPIKNFLVDFEYLILKFRWSALLQEELKYSWKRKGN